MSATAMPAINITSFDAVFFMQRGIEGASPPQEPNTEPPTPRVTIEMLRELQADFQRLDNEITAMRSRIGAQQPQAADEDGQEGQDDIELSPDDQAEEEEEEEDGLAI